MGGDTETARILGSVETVIAHRVNTPDEIVALAGTRKRPELTTRLAEDGLTRERSIRLEQRSTIDPNKIRALDPGKAYLISKGHAMKIQIPRAPTLTAPLPEPAHQVAPVPGHLAAENIAGSVPLADGSLEKEVLNLPF
jgi:hypothetical protein